MQSDNVWSVDTIKDDTFFLKTHAQNVVEKLISNHFLNQNWVYLRINSLMFYSLFLFYVQVENYNNILKLKGAALLLLYSLFLFYAQV